MTKHWGYHLILDCSGCDLDKINDPDLLKQWIGDLVQDLGMKPHGQPVITYNGEKPYHSGWTVVQIITTSSVVAHFIDQPPSCYLDVFSCKPFDPNMVKQNMEQNFGATRMREVFLTRTAE